MAPRDSGTPVSRSQASCSASSARERANRLFKEEGDAEGALELYRRALSELPQDAEHVEAGRLVCNYAAVLLHMGRPAEALSVSDTGVARLALAEAAAEQASDKHELKRLRVKLLKTVYSIAGQTGNMDRLLETAQELALAGSGIIDPDQLSTCLSVQEREEEKTAGNLGTGAWHRPPCKSYCTYWPLGHADSQMSIIEGGSWDGETLPDSEMTTEDVFCSKESRHVLFGGSGDPRRVFATVGDLYAKFTSGCQSTQDFSPKAPVVIHLNDTCVDILARAVVLLTVAVGRNQTLVQARTVDWCGLRPIDVFKRRDAFNAQLGKDCHAVSELLYGPSLHSPSAKVLDSVLGDLIRASKSRKAWYLPLPNKSNRWVGRALCDIPDGVEGDRLLAALRACWQRWKDCKTSLDEFVENHWTPGGGPLEGLGMFSVGGGENKSFQQGLSRHAMQVRALGAEEEVLAYESSALFVSGTRLGKKQALEKFKEMRSSLELNPMFMPTETMMDEPDMQNRRVNVKFPLESLMLPLEAYQGEDQGTIGSILGTEFFVKLLAVRWAASMRTVRIQLHLGDVMEYMTKSSCRFSRIDLNNVPDYTGVLTSVLAARRCMDVSLPTHGLSFECLLDIPYWKDTHTWLKAKVGSESSLKVIETAFGAKIINRGGDGSPSHLFWQFRDDDNNDEERHRKMHKPVEKWLRSMLFESLRPQGRKPSELISPPSYTISSFLALADFLLQREKPLAKSDVQIRKILSTLLGDLANGCFSFDGGRLENCEFCMVDLQVSLARHLAQREHLAHAFVAVPRTLSCNNLVFCEFFSDTYDDLMNSDGPFMQQTIQSFLDVPQVALVLCIPGLNMGRATTTTTSVELDDEQIHAFFNQQYMDPFLALGPFGRTQDPTGPLWNMLTAARGNLQLIVPDSFEIVDERITVCLPDQILSHFKANDDAWIAGVSMCKGLPLTRQLYNDKLIQAE